MSGLLLAVLLTVGVTRADVEVWAQEYAAWYANDAWSQHALAERTLRVAGCESAGWDPRVINGQRLGALGEVGVGQFHPRGIWWSTPQAQAGYSRFDPEANVAALTWAISQGYGPGHWYWCWRHA